MQELSAEERLLLERLLKSQEARLHIPVERQIAVSRAEKYAFPVGFDDAGNPFPVPAGQPGSAE